MAPVLLKKIVDVSSEDKDNPASNLLAASSGRRWLCSEDNKCRTAYVVIELCKRTRISSLELCNSGSAFVEVLVSDSENPETYVTLLHMSMLMTLQEARMGRNKSKVVSYGKDKLSSTAAAKKWNRVKIHCVQKYNREDQFGIRSISIFSDTHSSKDSVLLSPAQHNLLSPVDVGNKSSGNKRTMEQNREYRLKLPSSSDPLFDSSKAHDTSLTSTTPKKHPLQSRNSRIEGPSEQDEFEFSGLERQSRLFRNCLKGEESKDDLKPNKILSRISEEKSKYQDTMVGLHCPRKKLLKKELPKADVMRDFVDSYRDKEKSDSSQVTGAFRIMSRHDNDYEIGEEPEKTWGWNKFKGKPKKRGERSSKKVEVSGWISKRRKLTGMIGQCSDIFKKAGQEEAMQVVMEKEEAAEKHTKELENDYEEDLNSSNDTIVYSPTKSSHDEPVMTTPTETQPTPGVSLVECPLCLSFYPHYAIELHASECRGDDTFQCNAATEPVVID